MRFDRCFKTLCPFHPLIRIISVIFLLSILPIAACSAWAAYSFYQPEVSLNESKTKFEECVKALISHFGEDAVNPGHLIERHEVYFDADIELSDTLFEISMENYNGFESFTIFFETPAANSPQKSLPDNILLSNAAEIIEILSNKEYLKLYMEKHFNKSISSLLDDLSDPEYFRKKEENDYRFIIYDYEFAGRAVNGYNFNILTTEEGMYYTQVKVQFSCFE